MTGWQDDKMTGWQDDKMSTWWESSWTWHYRWDTGWDWAGTHSTLCDLCRWQWVTVSVLEERGPWNFTTNVNLCEIGLTTFNSVKFEAEKVISPNSQEHPKGKATAFSMNLPFLHSLIYKNMFSHWFTWNPGKFLLNVESEDPGRYEILKFPKTAVLRFWIRSPLTFSLYTVY